MSGIFPINAFVLNAFEAYLSLKLFMLSENYQHSLFKFFAKQYLMISCLNISGVFLNVLTLF